MKTGKRQRGKQRCCSLCGISLTVRNPLFIEKGLNPGVISKVG